MSDWVRAGVYSAYMKIAEPRVIRIIQFLIYSCLFVVGVMVLDKVPHSLEQASGGQEYVVGLAFMLIVGALCSGFAVLPGIWWLERAGLILLGFGLLIYLVMIIKLNSSPIGIVVCLLLILSFVQRWLEIKGAQLAPFLPKKRG
ncbi:membrane protein [Arthrobacter phage Truckee]|nr:membrane protein [Arthrobacter phage Truckee]